MSPFDLYIVFVSLGMAIVASRGAKPSQTREFSPPEPQLPWITAIFLIASACSSLTGMILISVFTFIPGRLTSSI